MCQRSLLALVFAVGLDQPGVQALTITLLCMGFAVMHYWCQPLQDSRANSMQVSAACQCLSTHGATRLPSGSAVLVNPLAHDSLFVRPTPTRISTLCFGCGMCALPVASDWQLLCFVPLSILLLLEGCVWGLRKLRLDLRVAVYPSHHWQNVFLSCLAVAALGTIPSAVGLEKPVPDTVQYPSDTMAQALVYLCGGPLPLLIVIDLHRRDILSMIKWREQGLHGRCVCCAAAMLLVFVGPLQLAHFLGNRVWNVLKQLMCCQLQLNGRVGHRRQLVVVLVAIVTVLPLLVLLVLSAVVA